VKANIADLRRSRRVLAGTPVPGRTCSVLRKAYYLMGTDSNQFVPCTLINVGGCGFVTERLFSPGESEKSDLWVYG
jgi:hypothetical protein